MKPTDFYQRIYNESLNSWFTNDLRPPTPKRWQSTLNQFEAIGGHATVYLNPSKRSARILVLFNAYVNRWPIDCQKNVVFIDCTFSDNFNMDAYNMSNMEGFGNATYEQCDISLLNGDINILPYYVE